MKSEERCALSDWPAKALIAPGVPFASMIDRAVSRSSVQRERRSRIRRFSLPYRCACCIGRGKPEPRRPNRILGPVIIPEQHCYGAVESRKCCEREQVNSHATIADAQWSQTDFSRSNRKGHYVCFWVDP
jgi:hypothetical protein